MSDTPTYMLERNFAASREMVWKAWTEPDLLARWYGPGAESVVHRLEVRPGGLWLHEMRWGGKSSFQRAEYIEVVQPTRLIWLHSVSDAEWNVIASPMMENWPRVLMTTVTFEQQRERTGMRLTWAPHQANEAEIACFAAALHGLDKGWAAGMEKLAHVLSEMRE